MERQCRVAVSFVRGKIQRQKKEDREREGKKEEGEEAIVLVHAPELLNKQYQFETRDVFSSLNALLFPSPSILDFLSCFQDSKTKVFQIIRSK